MLGLQLSWTDQTRPLCQAAWPNDLDLDWVQGGADELPASERSVDLPPFATTGTGRMF